MGKLMLLMQAQGGVSARAFAKGWSDEILPALIARRGVGDCLLRAVHHHAIPSGIRAEEGIVADRWSGVGTYYFDDAEFVDALAADTWMSSLPDHFPDLVARAVPLPVEEVWLYDRDPAQLPLKMFALFRRKPHLSRAQAQAYYRTTHAEIGESINHGRTLRYVQNHVRPNFHPRDPSLDFDAGPEIWFKSMDTALDLFGDAEAMRVLGEDEERFVIRQEIMNLLTDECTVYTR
jgi:hypothetical protein